MRNLLIICVALACLLTVPLALGGCSASEEPESAAENPGPPVVPIEADLSTPGSAVASYLDWITYAYRTADSEVATHTMTPGEAVRVDSYVQLNTVSDRAIEQELVSFEAPAPSIEGTSAVLTVSEDWLYRYITMSTGYYDGPLHEVSYDATYTLVLEDDRWLVDKVEATPLGPLE